MSYDALVYHGGPVMRSAQFMTVFWGPFTNAEMTEVRDYLSGFAGQLSGKNAPSGKVPVLWEYGCRSASLATDTYLDSAVPSGVQDGDDRVNKLKAWQDAGHIPKRSNGRLVIVLSKGIQHDPGWGGYHQVLKGTDGDLYYAFCLSWADKHGQAVISHEVTEALTDPAPGSGWTSHGVEGADLYGDNVVPPATFPFGAVQLFSDNRSRTGDVWTKELFNRREAAVTALVPRTGHIDLFTIAPDGGVWSTWWESSAKWQPWFAIDPRYKMQSGAEVTALAPRTGHVDLFATGADGTVWSSWWESAKGWQPWFPICQGYKMQPGATVTALVPRDGHIDLFATDPDGAGWSTWWESGQGWQDWFPVGAGDTGQAAKMRPGTDIAALKPREAHIDLFATGSDGTVWSTWWEATPGWQAWFPIHQESKMQPGATITALVPRPGHIDLFATGPDGTVWSTWWEAGKNWQAWFPIHQESKMQPGTTVSALVPRVGHIDLFATDTNGTVRSTWWESGKGWQAWFSIGGSGALLPGTRVTSLRPRDGHIDLFATAPDGTVVSTWWESAKNWQNWFALPAPEWRCG